jgi:hypothetical protein
MIKYNLKINNDKILNKIEYLTLIIKLVRL